MVPTEGEWWKWRGGTDERADQHEEELRKLWDWKDNIEERLTDARRSVAIMETKVAMFAAGGSVIGGALVAFLEHFLK